jgi:hypothetical protein
MTTDTTLPRHAKPVRLEINNSGSWKVLGRFDAADELQASLVLDAADDMVRALHNSEDPKNCPALRVSVDPITVLLRWDLARGWHDAASGRSV